jgi:two-component system, LytTR family, response regulator
MNHIRILGNKPQDLPIERILYLEANINYTIIHTIDGKRFLSSRTLKVYEDRLPQFIRANKKELLNRNYIQKSANSDIIILSNGNEISISRRRKETFKTLLSLTE